MNINPVSIPVTLAKFFGPEKEKCMKKSLPYSMLVLLLLMCHCGSADRVGEPCIGPSCENSDNSPIFNSKLEKFASQDDFETYVKGALKTATEKQKSQSDSSGGIAADAPTTASPSAESDTQGNDSITNNQEAGVDEGGIVKKQNDHLLILRRGHLASVKVHADGKLEQISYLEVPAAGLDNSAWYDELLVHENLALVIGYRWHQFDTYSHGLVEMNFFNIADNGTLSRSSTYFVESSDYYSWKNYASRLVGDNLVFYMPQAAYRYEGSAYEMEIPYIHRYEGNGKIEPYKPLIRGVEVYKPNAEMLWPVYHSIVSCSLNNVEDFSCSTQTFLGSWGHEFYVTPKTAYLYLTNDEGGLIYGMALDGSSSGVIQTSVYPRDQFSFSQSEKGLFVFGTPAGIDRCFEEGAVLAEIPFETFGPSVASLPSDAYHCLPGMLQWGVDYWWNPMINRFHDRTLAYGHETALYLVDLASKEVTSLTLPYSLSRIERAGSSFLTFGLSYDSDNYEYDLGMNSIAQDRLSLSEPLWVWGAFESEWRSHGFSYVETEQGNFFGLGIGQVSTNDDSYYYHYDETVGLFQVANDGFLSEAGSVEPASFRDNSEMCTVSCIDWYGDTRPIFFDDLVLGLMGDQLTSGKIEDGHFEAVSNLNITTAEVN